MSKRPEPATLDLRRSGARACVPLASNSSEPLQDFQVPVRSSNFTIEEAAVILSVGTPGQVFFGVRPFQQCQFSESHSHVKKESTGTDNTMKRADTNSVNLIPVLEHMCCARLRLHNALACRVFAHWLVKPPKAFAGGRNKEKVTLSNELEYLLGLDIITNHIQVVR
jgi:hypothetical protein